MLPDNTEIEMPEPDTGTQEIPQELARLRSSIDNIDAAIVHIMAERFKFTRQVGELKSKLGLPAADPTREGVQIARLRRLAEESQLDPEFAQELIAFIVAKVVQNHEKIRDAHTG